MSKWVALMKLTDEGAKALEQSPDRIGAARMKWEALGGHVDAIYVLMGEYDFLAIGEAPSDYTPLAWDAAMAKSGAVRTLTMKAFEEDDWYWILREATDDYISKLPGAPPVTRRKRDE